MGCMRAPERTSQDFIELMEQANKLFLLDSVCLVIQNLV